MTPEQPVVSLMDWCRHNAHLTCPGEGISQYRRVICGCDCHRGAA